MEPRREMKILALGLPRTGTLSMAEALTMLGYRDVHHTLKYSPPQNEPFYRFASRAADTVFPTLPTYTGGTLTRHDFDQVYGNCEAVTEFAAMFAPQLIQAYPEAKVVVVVRDFDRWLDSVQMFLDFFNSKKAAFVIRVAEPLFGLTPFSTVKKTLLGFFQIDDISNAREVARSVFDGHHRVIREMVPADRLLFYKLAEGWEPLCKFLDKPIPYVPFPRVNEMEFMKAKADNVLPRLTRYLAFKVLSSRPLLIAVVVTGIWTLAKGRMF